RRMGLRPVGILDPRYCAAELPSVPDGLDHRLQYRFYRDPPEFLTILSGDSDGLHFGLFYDDLAEPCVTHYYARDGGGLAGPDPTLLHMVRRLVEYREGHTRTGSLSERERDDERRQLAVVRDAVMDFETVERQEQGWDYIEKHRASWTGLATVD